MRRFDAAGNQLMSEDRHRTAMVIAQPSRRKMMGDFRRLVAWQQGYAFALAVHRAFAGRRTHAAPGSRAQILRAVSSIPDALAEGSAKRSRKELARYADIAYGSAKEVENQLIKARDLGLLPSAEVEDLLRMNDRVARLCFGLSRRPSTTTDRR